MPITLDREEEITILEEIAREGSAVARIQALRRLQELRDAEPAGTGFDKLDGKGKTKEDQLAQRRRAKVA